MKEPIAIISSTIAPSNLEHYGETAARYDPALRLEQTCASIQSLLALGVKEIYLADNSGVNWQEGMEKALRPANVQVFHHYQYRNKGISELYLLLTALPRLPSDRPIIKLSGRYRLGRRLDAELGADDFVTRQWADRTLWPRAISTVAYAVSNAAVYERFLRETLRVIFGYSARIVGPRSLFTILRNSLFPGQDRSQYADPSLSIEHAAGQALRNEGYKVRAVESLGVEGIAGQGGNHYTQ